MGFKKSKANSLKLPKGVSMLQQTYEGLELPNGVVVIKLNVFFDDNGGWFRENLRVDIKGNVIALKEKGIDFKILQSNVSMVSPGSRRFWHLHPDTKERPGQNEIWTTNATLLVGLVDLRKQSKTCGVKSKVVLSSDKALYIPAGVAHGFFNPTNENVTLIYFADKHFSADDDTQEYRIDPKQLSYDFVLPEEM